MGELALSMREVAGSMPASSINERFEIGCTWLNHLSLEISELVLTEIS